MISAFMKYCVPVICLILFVTRAHSQTNGIIINEILVSNATINANEVGQYNDWIEIYNNTDANINLKGYYFTNNIEQPKKFKVPRSMVLRPGVYCILWADELDNNNRPYTHLNFKLKKKGGELALFHPDGKTLVHRLTYKQQYTDFSSSPRQIKKTTQLERRKPYLWLRFPSPLVTIKNHC